MIYKSVEYFHIDFLNCKKQRLANISFGVVDWRGSALEVISAIIGSSLFGIVVTAAVSDYNKPDINIDLNTKFEDSGSSLYSITTRNAGRSAATDFRVSVFLPGYITWHTVSVHGENVTIHIPKNYRFNSLLDQFEPSVLVANTSRLTSNSFIAIDILTKPTESTTPFRYPVYVTATYNEGSRDSHYTGTRINPHVHLPVIEDRRPLVSHNVLILIVISLISVIFFAIALKRTKDKRNLARSISGIEEEIREARHTLEKCKKSSEKIPTEFWVAYSSRKKHEMIRNSKDYEAIEQFYNTVTNRNSATTSADQFIMEKYNKECLNGANNALETIDWSKYYVRLGSDRTIDLLLAFLVSIPAAFIIFYVFENLPLGFLLPEVFVRPSDMTMPAPLDGSYRDFIGRVWFHALTIKYALIFTFISFMVRGFLAFFIAREIIRRIYRDTDKPVSSHDNFLTSKITSSHQEDGKLLGLSFLIMGFPMWATFSLFFSESVYDALRNEFGANLLFVVVVIEIMRMSVLVVLVPELSHRRKISLVEKHIVAVKERAIMYLSSGIMILAGTFHLILFGTFVQRLISSSIFLKTDLFVLFGYVPANSLILFIGFVSLGLSQIIIGIFALQNRSKVISYSTLALAIIVVMFWFVAIAILTQARPDLLEIQSGDPILLPLQLAVYISTFGLYYDDIITSGIMILIMMFICIFINILLRSQLKSNKKYK